MMKICVFTSVTSKVKVFYFNKCHGQSAIISFNDHEIVNRSAAITPTKVSLTSWDTTGHLMNNNIFGSFSDWHEIMFFSY